jgi:hypothetical protein
VVVVLTGDEAEAIGRMLGEAIKYAYQARGWPVPPLLAEWRGLLARSAKGRAFPQVPGSDVAAGVRDGPPLPLSEQSARLTVREAACLARVSEGHMRRLIRRGDVEAIRSHGGAWAVDISSASAWITSQRRKERDQKVA